MKEGEKRKKVSGRMNDGEKKEISKKKKERKNTLSNIRGRRIRLHKHLVQPPADRGPNLAVRERAVAVCGFLQIKLINQSALYFLSLAAMPCTRAMHCMTWHGMGGWDEGWF